MKSAMAVTAVVVLLLCGATVVPAQDTTEAAAQRALAQRIAEQTAARIEQHYRLPYLGLAVVYRGQTALLARGYSDQAQTIAFDAHESVVRAASMGKLPTALVAAELLSEHEIAISAPVRQHVHSIPVPTRERTPFQFEHLLTHTEGFELQSFNTRTLDPEELIPLREFLNRSPPVPFQRPGLMTTYGNLAAAVLGATIEELSGQPFAETIKQRLFEPAAMSSSTFDQPLPPALAERRAAELRYQGASLRLLEPSWSQLVPAEGFHTTVADAARLISLLQSGGRFGDQRILSQDTVRRALEIRFRNHRRLPGVSSGFLEQQHAGLRLLIRDGDSEGMMSRMILVPQADIGLFLVTGTNNTAPRTTTAGFLAQALCDEIACPDPLDGYPLPELSEPLQTYNGLYSLTNRPRNDVSRLPLQVSTLLRIRTTDAGTLLVTPMPDDPFAGIDRPTEFHPLGEQLFESADRSLRIAFARGPLGEVRYLFSGGGYHGTYEKLQPWQRLYFALAGLVLPILLCVIETLRRIITTLARTTAVQPDTRQRMQRIGMTAFAAVITAFAALLVPALALVGSAAGLPPWELGMGAFAYTVFSLPLVGFAAVLWTLALGARSVPTGLAISVPAGIMDRLLLASVPILFVALYHWRLLGFWF